MPRKGIGILQAVPCFQRWSERSGKYVFVARTKRTTHNTELMCDRNLAIWFRVILWSRREREYHKRMHDGGTEQSIHKTEVFQWWMPVHPRPVVECLVAHASHCEVQHSDCCDISAPSVSVV